MTSPVPAMPFAAPTSAAPPLSVRLREATRDAHQIAERAEFMRSLLRGAVTREVYGRYLAALHRLYTALEAGLDRHRAHSCVAPLHWPSLWRGDPLARDLAAIFGTGWHEHVLQDTLSDTYVARLATVAGSDPALLVAHAYTRYLGDLSGGQILRTAVARIAPDALALYEFPDLDIPQARQSFRARLDALPLGPRAEAVLAEARLAFDLHGDLVAPLAAATPGSGAGSSQSPPDRAG